MIEYTAEDYDQALRKLSKSDQRKVIGLWKDYVKALKNMDRTVRGHDIESIRSGEVAATLLHMDICNLLGLVYKDRSYRSVLSEMNWR